MAVTYAWSIEKLHCLPTFTDPNTSIVYQKVVMGVSWLCVATDGVNTATAYGRIPIAWDRTTPFTLFTDLTRSLVGGWAQANLNAPNIGQVSVASIRNKLAAQLADMASPAVISADPPWGAP